MTITSSDNRNAYSGNGTTTVFAYTFKIADASHLTVTLVNSTGTETTQTLTTHYTVSGVDLDAGGNVTMLTAPATGEKLIITRNQPFQQNTDYVTGSAFSADTHEAALDELTMNDIEQNEVLSRTIKSQLQDGAIADLPRVADRASKVLTFDANGDPETSVLTADIANLINNLSVGTEISGYSTVFEYHLGSDFDGSNKVTLSQSYTPGNNNLFVFRNGQGPLRKGSGFDYTETSSTEVTLTYDPNDGDTFLFVIGVLSSAGSIDASNVTYSPAGTGAVDTNVQDKLREWVSVTDFGAVGDGVTDDLSAINSAITYCSTNNKSLFFPAGTYAVSDTVNIIDKDLHMIGEYNPYANKGSAIKFTGSADSLASVVEYHANTAAILASGIHGIRLDANNLAGRSLTLRATSAALKHFYLEDFYLGGFTSRGIDLVGSATGSELAECYYNDGQIYSANTGGLGFGIYTSTGTNISFHRFNNVRIDADAGNKLKNCAYFSTGGGFYFNDCLFAQTVTQTGTDGYVAYSAGGFVQFHDCWNEADGWLYMGNSSTAQAVTALINCHESNPSTYDVFFNTQYHHLDIRGCSFNNNIYLGSNVNIGGVSIDGIKFASGKGVIDASSSSSDPALNWGSREDPKATYTYTSGTLTLNQYAKVHEITLEASITNLAAPGSTSNELTLIFIQDGVGSHTVTFASSFGFAGGSAPTITATASAIDVIHFQRLTGATNFIEVARSQNIS